MLSLGVGILLGGLAVFMALPYIAASWDEQQAAKFAEEIDDWRDEWVRARTEHGRILSGSSGKE